MNQQPTFSAVAQQGMVKKGWNRAQLARAVGCSRENIDQVLRSGRVPSMRTAVRYADALDMPALATMVRNLRTITCAVCGTPAIQDGPKARTYCSSACGRVALDLGRRTPSGLERSLIRRLGVLQGAVAGMCAACEPEGLCRTATCPLRYVSPLPMATVEIGDPGPAQVVRPETWHNRSEAMKKLWAERRDYMLERRREAKARREEAA